MIQCHNCHKTYSFYLAARVAGKDDRVQEEVPKGSELSKGHLPAEVDNPQHRERESDNSWPRNVKPCKSTLTEETQIFVQLLPRPHPLPDLPGLPGCTIKEVIVAVILSGVVQCSGLLADFAACLIDCCHCKPHRKLAKTGNVFLLTRSCTTFC